MTVKELAYATQQYLQAKTGTQFKRAHIYELLAACFDYRSYAAFCADAIFAARLKSSRGAPIGGDGVSSRCVELGYPPATGAAVAAVLPALLAERGAGVIRLDDLVVHLRQEFGYSAWREYSVEDGDFSDEEFDSGDSGALEDSEWYESPIVLDGLGAAANRGSAAAHHALALIYSRDGDDSEEEAAGDDYWYNQERNGRVLSGVEKEWADAYRARLERETKYVFHLREAARLGHQEALLDLADRFDDPAFFEQDAVAGAVDRSLAADVAERMGRSADARRWLTEAAKHGDVEAMRRLIEDYDHGDLQACWTWLYLAELLGTDLAKDEYRAVHEDGSDYDDDVGGPMHAVGRDGVVLEPILDEQDVEARYAAKELYDALVATKE